jgi:NAD(P)-dependent dehydrogenase (short-subunit alcohol dehydrogenase family)
MKGKVVVLTGATSGIGRATAFELAGAGARLLLIARHEGRAKQTEREIRERSREAVVQTFLADLSSQREIRRVAEEVLAAAPRIDVLVNNAGVVQRRRTVTADGFEATFATNHLGYYLLTRLLIGRLQESRPARIVNVASDAHRLYPMDFDDLQSERKYRLFRTYCRSKLANLMFTYELSRRLEGTGVTVNALHPGWVATQLGLDDGLLSRGVGIFSRLCARTPEQGADTAIWLASSAEVEGVTGKYFQDRRELQSNVASRDPENQRRLWEISARLVGLEGW